MELELTCQLLLLFDRKNILSDMKNVCENFLRNLDLKTTAKFQPFRYLLELDVLDLFEQYPSLGELLLSEPLKFQKLSNEILFACLKAEKNESSENVLDSQTMVLLRLKCLPRYLVNTSSRSYGGLSVFSGLLISLTKPISYVFHSVWSCPEDCDRSEVICQCIPKNPPRCYMCKSLLYENSGLRRCGEQVTATFIFNNKLLTKNFKIVDDLIPKLTLGARYDLHAVIVKTVMSIWSIEEVEYLPMPIKCPVPDEIQELYQVCEGIPWKFIYCIASSIGVNVCPLNCFMHLKLCLLISLASVKANTDHGADIVHVMAAGYDTSYVGILMTDAIKLSDRSVILGTTNTDPSTALIGSSGGVCLMPLPLHTYNQKHISSILTAIESEEIVLGTGKIEMKSAVWAQGYDCKKITVLNIASVFSNTVRGDYGDYQDDIAEFILQKAIEPVVATEEEAKALQEVKLYLDLVAGIKVALDRKCENVLKNYFLAARREKPRGVSLGSMKAMMAICLTSARLCRRSTTLIDDAVLAIWLHVSGCQEPRFAPDEYLQTPADVKKLTQVFDSFKDWLEKFTGTCLF